jgi:hypothetical protein
MVRATEKNYPAVINEVVMPLPAQSVPVTPKQQAHVIEIAPDTPMHSQPLAFQEVIEQT